MDDASLYPTVLNAIDEVLYVSDPETYELLFVNDALRELMGEISVGDKCYKILQNRSAPCPFCTNGIIFGEKMGTPYVWEFQNEITKKWYRCSDKAIRWTDGRLVRFEIATDITERKLLETELEKSRKKYHGIFDESVAAIYVIDNKMNFIDSNKAGIDLLGYTRDELIGTNLLDVFPDTNLGTTVYNQILAGIRLINYEHRLIRKDAEILTVLNNSMPIMDENRNVIGVQSTIIDITELKRVESERNDLQRQLLVIQKEQVETVLQRSESRVRLINDNLVNGMVYQVIRMPDGKRKFTYLSDRVKDFYGVTPEEVLADAGLIYGRIHPDEVDRLVGEEEKAYAAMSIFQAKARVVKPDGEIRWSQFVSRPRKEEEDGLVYWDGIEFDITPLKNAEEALSAYKNQLERMVDERTQELKKTTEQLLQSQKMEAIGQLAGGVAHDFNNIIATISGTAEMLVKVLPPDDPVTPKLNRILNSSRKAKDLTMKLLTFARKEKLNVKPINPKDIVADVVDMLKSTTKSIIEVTTEYDEEAKLINADANQILQAILNMCLNACDAMPNGGRLTIRVREVVLNGNDAPERNGEFVVISVEDTGTGIDEDKIDNIFEPFFTTKDKGKGSGLGLSVSHGIIKAHNGFIEVRTAKDRGTTFDVFLPVKHSRDTATDEEKSDGRMREAHGHIFIIDDDMEFCQMIEESLSEEGFMVSIAHSGIEAVDIYSQKSEEMDVIILDMILPEMKGTEIFQALKGLNPAAKIVLCSGYSIEGEATALLEEGAKAFIQKPFGISEIVDIIFRLVEQD